MNSSNHIAGAAARIRERANQLSSERTELQDIGTALDDAKHQISNQKDTTLDARSIFLSTIRVRNGLELESMRKKRKLELLESDLDRIRVDLDQIRERTSSLQEEHGKLSSNIYASHFVRIETYQRWLESHLAHQVEERNRRDRQLETIRSQAAKDREEIILVREETQHLATRIRELDRNEVTEDEEIVGHSMQVNAMITKVRIRY